MRLKSCAKRKELSMIRKSFILVLLIGVAMSLCAQTNVSLIDIKKEMNELYQELAQLDQAINSINAVGRYETKYLSHRNLMESCFNAYSAEIRENKEMLYTIYENYQTLYANIGKKISIYKERDNIRIETERVKAKLVKFESDMNNLFPKAKDFCEHKKNDSLEKTKSSANTIFNNALGLQASNQSLFDENVALETIMNSISKTHDEINSLTIKKSKFGDILFKIIMVVGMVLMAGNIVSSKIKMMNAMKPSVKTPKIENKNKKEEEFSI